MAFQDAETELLEKVLQPYKDHCKYLKSAVVVPQDGLVAATCRFAVPESCYIDDTGHLNSVEVNICFNQMMYYTVAKSVEQGLLSEFASWTLQDYWKHQLPDILIARFATSFRRPVNPRQFYGEIKFLAADRKSPSGAKPFIMAQTAHRYWDTEGGRCDGEATLAFVNLPDADAS